MKNPIKLIAAAFMAAALFFTTNVKAQTVDKSAWRFGVGVEGLLPTGNLHNLSNIGLGGTARVQYGVSSNLALMLTSGYYNYFGKAIGDGTDTKYPSFGLVPLKAGAKVFVDGGFYFSGEVGAGFETRDVYADNNGNKDTKLLLSPGLGWANKSWDVGARYENFSGQSNNYGTVALRVAYGFAL